ncbi:MAG: carboxypeptidase regulatory-like domain-containing protein [Chloracidobacterium sp.]|nr:carboxypeptidase regulatory-like domain-containing protein [Chloracidobacterium sp.]
MKITRLIVLVTICLTAMAGVIAQSGGMFVIQKSVIAGGGGSTSGGIFMLDGTIGQCVAGENSTGGSFSLASGFGAISGVTPTSTPTATSTSTPTATPTATPAGGAITGTVTYGNAIPAATRFVSNVQISGAGSVPVSIFTGGIGATEGQYLLSGFGADAYTVMPTKTGGVNGSIGSFDAARIAQHAAGPPLPQLTGSQLLVADVSNNGAITSFDAGMVAKFAAGPPYAAPGIGLTGAWKFAPASRDYPSVAASIAGEDYSALLMGEVSGNCANTGARPTAGGNGPERSTAVNLPRLLTPADNDVVIPVAIQGAANKGIISYEFDLRYDPTVIQPQADPVDLAGSVSSKLSAVANPSEPGLLRIVVYGPLRIDGNGVLLNLRFTAVGAPGSVSPLTWERVMFNEGDPGTLASDGQVELLAAAPNQAEISGRLLTTMGQRIPNARVTLTDTAVQSRSVVSNGFGVYRFGGLQVGQTYTISVQSHLTFTPLTVSVTGQLASVDMIAEP